MMTSSKSYNIKVYTKDKAAAVKTLSYKPKQPTEGKDEVLLSVPKFSAKKNGGLGSCKLEFNVGFDDFGGLSSVIVAMNHFEIFEINDDFPTGILIYSGFLDSFDPYIKNGKEGVLVKLLGYASVFTIDTFKTSGGSELVSYTATDPGQMARDIVTRISAICPLLSFDTDSIPLLGFTADYEFDGVTWKNAIDLVRNIAGSNYYWYVDQSNKVHLKPKSVVYDRSFTVGKHVQEVAGKIKTDEVKNRIVLTWSGGVITKTDAASISAYWQRTESVDATSITDATAAEIQAQYWLDSLKDAITSVVVKLNTAADFYDIKPGQTIKIQGLKSGQTIFGNNLQIESVKYSCDTMILTLEKNRTMADDIKSIAETAQKF